MIKDARSHLHRQISIFPGKDNLQSATSKSSGSSLFAARYHPLQHFGQSWRPGMVYSKLNKNHVLNSESRTKLPLPDCISCNVSKGQPRHSLITGDSGSPTCPSRRSPKWLKSSAFLVKVSAGAMHTWPLPSHILWFL